MKNKNVKIITHYQEGLENDIVCVFSCPGRHEEIARRPAAKTTGTNLDNLFELLNEHLQTDIFARKNVTVTNSWSRVEYPEMTGRTEATDNEILQFENLDRLCHEVRNVDKYIICFGGKAFLATSALKNDYKIKPSIKILRTDHLSLSRINRKINQDINGNPILSADIQKERGDQRSKATIRKENTKKRLEVIALDIVSQI